MMGTDIKFCIFKSKTKRGKAKIKTIIITGWDKGMIDN